MYILYIYWPFCIVLLLAEMMVEVYDSAATGKMWSSFTKGQRKTITQWKEQAKVRDTSTL